MRIRILCKSHSKFQSGSIDQMNGDIDIDSLQFTAPEKEYFMKNLHVAATQEAGINKLALTSEFMTANVEGRFLYPTLPASIMNIMRSYIPSLILPPKKQIETDNNFSFDIHIFNVDILSSIFDIPLKIYTHSTIKGYVNDRMHVFG